MLLFAESRLSDTAYPAEEAGAGRYRFSYKFHQGGKAVQEHAQAIRRTIQNKGKDQQTGHNEGGNA